MERYTFSDPIIKGHHSTWEGLNVEKTVNSSLRIFRLLSGTLILNDDFTNKKYIFKTNYFKSPFEFHKRYKQSSILDNFPEELSMEDIANFFKTNRKNTPFYKTLEHEFLNCLVARHKEQYLESFLFLYRILEGISYSIPLIYTAKSNEFLKSFEYLKSFLSKTANGGELNFLKIFFQQSIQMKIFF